MPDDPTFQCLCSGCNRILTSADYRQYWALCQECEALEGLARDREAASYAHHTDEERERVD